MSVATVVTIETPGLGDRSYVVHDGDIAVVVDPQRDIDRVTGLVARLGVRITHVLETHLHNDYVTGGLALARRVGARYLVPAGDRVGFERVAVSDGDRFTTGQLVVTAVHTPGHTPNHTSYVVAGPDGDPEFVFTGGSMLFGAVGRTDLISADMTEELTRAQFRSVRRLAADLPDAVEVMPTHGFGSFCSASETTGDSSTVGRQRRENVALQTDDEDRFVEDLMASLSAYPLYYAHMAGLNAAGPGEADLSAPELVDPGVVRRRIDAGEWVVDLRNRRAFARRHVAGTVSIELDDPFATYFGWALPWQAPVTLIGESPDQVLAARRQLARIGVDDLAGAAVGDIAALADGREESYRVATFAELGENLGRHDVVVLDVRRQDEWDAGHLVDAVHIPFWELADRMGEVPPGELWVHCAAGLRAAIGSSIAARSGRTVVHVDDDWEKAGQLGLPIEAGRSGR